MIEIQWKYINYLYFFYYQNMYPHTQIYYVLLANYVLLQHCLRKLLLPVGIINFMTLNIA